MAIKKEYRTSKDLSILAKKIIEQKNPNGLKESNAEFEFLLVYPHISKTVAGRCSRIKDNIKFLTGLDYIIEMSGQIWDQLNDDVKEKLMYHELLHAFPEYNEKSGEWLYKIRDHNVKDFYQLVSKYGLDWFTSLKTIISSVHDLKPKEEDNIKI